MKALFIGGTGTISAAITRKIALMPQWELYLLNRGKRNEILPQGVKTITADIHDEADVAAKIKELEFDCVCDFIAFLPEDVERDFRLFNGKTKQYMCISSASAYRKPVENHIITEDTPLDNPYWEYSRNKALCEEVLMRHYREDAFPVTIIRPSHTYDERKIPVGVHGKGGSYQILKRMLEGKPVIIPGDGTSLWTLTHNSDFAKAFVGLMGNEKAIGEAFHITSDESLCWNSIYRTVAEELGVEYKPYHVSSQFLAKVGRCYDLNGALWGDKANSVVFDNSKVKALVPDFVATTPFREGVHIAWEYISSHPELQVEDKEFDRWCDRLIEVLDKAGEEF